MLLSFRGYLDEMESEKTKPLEFSCILFIFCMCNVVSAAALPIFKSSLVKAVAPEFLETCSIKRKFVIYKSLCAVFRRVKRFSTQFNTSMHTENKYIFRPPAHFVN